METSFKSRAFPFVFWIMIIALLWDTYDTFSREVIGYFKGSIPLGDINIETRFLRFICKCYSNYSCVVWHILTF